LNVIFCESVRRKFLLSKTLRRLFVDIVFLLSVNICLVFRHYFSRCKNGRWIEMPLTDTYFLFRFLDIPGILISSKCVLTVLLPKILTKHNLIYMPAIKNLLHLNMLYSWHSFLLTLNETQRTDTLLHSYHDVKFVRPVWQLVILLQSLRRETSERKCVIFSNSFLYYIDM
jgi:hypothetical protein